MSGRDLEDFVEACRARRGTEVAGELKDATAAFLAETANRPTLLRQAADLLGGLPPAGAAWLALTLGTSIERGSDVELTAPPLLAYFRNQLALFPDTPPDDSPDPVPDASAEQAALIEVFPAICQAVVAHLARAPERREALAHDQALLDRLEELQYFGWGATWVREALLKSSGTLVALHPPTGVGVRLRYVNVSNCFHLFSLVQTAIGHRISGGRTPNPTVAAAARAEIHEPVNDQAWWHYGDPRSRQPDLSASIWGEGLVRDIPSVEGVQTVLLWPPLLQSRGWDSGFFGPQLAAMPPDVTLEHVLSRDASRSLLQRLGLDGLRKGWRIW
ncbi:MAG TPA: hypothetical protein VNW92_06175 [Polyangiaceae bacterium]|jgi:hypothetical protein|nr:hypothetical protein [Polyangiaceae bacterium]